MQDFIGNAICYEEYRAKAQTKVIYPSVDPFVRVHKALELARNPQGPVHDLGDRFFKEVLLKNTKPEDWEQQAEDARHLFSGSLPFVKPVQFLACWLMHPEPEKRPTLEKVCEVLEKHLPLPPSPPSLTAVDFGTLDGKSKKFFNLSASKNVKLTTAEIVVKFLNENRDFQPISNVYTRGKDTKNSLDRIYSLRDAEDRPYFIILHKKSSASDLRGVSKVGRVCHIIQKRGDTWEANRSYALTSKYGKKEISKKTKKTPKTPNTPNTQKQEYYKEFYPKEMALYKMTQGQNIFIQHRASFFFADKAKQHKRLGIYDCAITTLYQSIDDKTCTLQQQLNLISRVQELHAKRLVHGDIKPDNVLIGSGGTVYLGDVDSVSEEQAVRGAKEKGFHTEYYLPKNPDEVDRFTRDRIALIRTLKQCNAAYKVISEDTPLDQLAAELEKLAPKKQRRAYKEAMLQKDSASVVEQMEALELSDDQNKKKNCMIQ